MKSKIVSIFSSIGALISGCFGGACGVACLAGGCCGSYALFGFIGISGSGLAFMQKLTPVFLILTIVSLGYAFYVAYKPKPKPCCTNTNGTPDQAPCCSKPAKKSFLKSKSFLWITTVICLVMWTYPYIFKSSSKSASCCDVDSRKKTEICCNSNNQSVNCCPSTPNNLNPQGVLQPPADNTGKNCCSEIPNNLKAKTNSAFKVCCPE
jgi:hypothetical protein